MEANRQKDELEERMKLWREQHHEMASALSGQSFPEGVQVHSMASDDEMPPLEPINKVRIEEEEGEEEEEPKDDPIVDVEDAEISSTVPQRQTSTVKEEDILFQVHLRGAGLTEEHEQQYSNTMKKGKSKKETGRTYLVGLVEKLINSGKWTAKVNDELLRKRMEDWRVMKGKGKATKG